MGRPWLTGWTAAPRARPMAPHPASAAPPASPALRPSWRARSGRAAQAALPRSGASARACRCGAAVNLQRQLAGAPPMAAHVQLQAALLHRRQAEEAPEDCTIIILFAHVAVITRRGAPATVAASAPSRCRCCRSSPSSSTTCRAGHLALRCARCLGACVWDTAAGAH